MTNYYHQEQNSLLDIINISKPLMLKLSQSIVNPLDASYYIPAKTTLPGSSCVDKGKDSHVYYRWAP